jgi:hypothetical protein
MAMALRPRLSPKSMASRYGSQALGPVTTAESVITSFSLAGFEVAFAFPFVERFSGLGLGLGLGLGIGNHRNGRFCRTGVGDHFVGRFWFAPPPATGRTHRNPRRFQVGAAVSRRTWVACWMRRSDQPSRPRAKTCCFFSSFKTLAMPTEPTSLRGIQASAGFNVPDATLVGRFSGDNHWPVLGDR